MSLLDERRRWERRRAAAKRKHGFHRHPIIGQTKLSAMHRFLQETQRAGCAAPLYHQQWKTLFAAERLGYIKGYAEGLTAKGKKKLAELNKKMGVK